MIAALIYPHQLFKNNLLVDKADRVFLIEDPLFFGDKKYPLKFHKFKLILHRASMKQYFDDLRVRGKSVGYIDYNSKLSSTNTFFKYLKKEYSQVLVYDPVDFILEKRLKKEALKNKIELVFEGSPNFINSNNENQNFFKGKKKFRLSEFYVWQRTRFGILIDGGGFPEGGKWSFDTENRKKLPKEITFPRKREFRNEYIEEAIAYVSEHFRMNPGPDLISKITYPYPTSHAEAELLLEDFIDQKLEYFGPYEDAISDSDNFVFHSILSSSINIGLIDPRELINKVLKKYFEIRKADNLKAIRMLPSVEGFIRQVIGWREFMRAVYVLKGVEIRNSNFFKHEGKLTESWYSGNTGVEPVDSVIVKANQLAYSHHIERLMIMGNFMLLNNLHPDEVYKWFMEMYIDSYDWVMVPNVYSMSQFADGGTITTKPYFSGSNYILKMSNFKKGTWTKQWDDLFWNFVRTNQNFLLKNPRLGLMAKLVEKKSEEEIKNIEQSAKKFIYSMTIQN